MKLPLYPKILCISDPDFANKPYPYPFQCIPYKIKSLSSSFLYLDITDTTFKLYKDSIKNFKPDLIFGFIQPLEQLKKMADFLNEYHPVPAINWNLEDPNFIVHPSLNYNMIDTSASFDMWFGIDNKMLPFWKTKAALMPLGYDDSVYYNFKINRVFDISYIGNVSYQNDKMYWPYFKEIAAYKKKAAMCINRPMGLPLLPDFFEKKLRSQRYRRFFQSMPFWQCYWENPIDEQAKALLINKSKIHFGLNRLRGTWEQSLKNLLPNYSFDKHGLFYQLKSRVFNAVGTCTMALNEYCPELEDLFEIGKEIITFEFGEVEEMKEKLSWYLTHNSERERVAKAGYERGRKQHTLTARIKQILDTARNTL